MVYFFDKELTPFWRTFLLSVTETIVLYLRGTAPLDLIFEDFVHFLKK